MKAPSFIKMFFLGIITAFGALVLELLFFLSKPAASVNSQTTLGLIFVLVVVIEETLKLLVIRKISLENYNSLFYNAFYIGIGFAFTEIFLNAFNYPYFSLTLFIEYFGLFLVQTFTALLYGYWFSRPKNIGLKMSTVAFLLAGAIHFLFNFSAILGINYLILDGILGLLTIWLVLNNFKKKNRLLPN